MVKNLSILYITQISLLVLMFISGYFLFLDYPRESIVIFCVTSLYSLVFLGVIVAIKVKLKFKIISIIGLCCCYFAFFSLGEAVICGAGQNSRIIILNNKTLTDWLNEPDLQQLPDVEQVLKVDTVGNDFYFCTYYQGNSVRGFVYKNSHGSETPDYSIPYTFILDYWTHLYGKWYSWSGDISY